MDKEIFLKIVDDFCKEHYLKFTSYPSLLDNNRLMLYFTEIDEYDFGIFKVFRINIVNEKYVEEWLLHIFHIINE